MTVLNAPAARDYPEEYKRPRTIFHTLSAAKWYFVAKIVFSDRKKLLKFETGGQELSKNLRSLEQFIPTVKGQKNFW
jgi:hypothetical protein